MKECTRCHKQLPLTSFYKQKRYRNGVASWCKECTKHCLYKYFATKKGQSAKRKAQVSYLLTTEGRDRLYEAQKRYLRNLKLRSAA